MPPRDPQEVYEDLVISALLGAVDEAKKEGSAWVVVPLGEKGFLADIVAKTGWRYEIIDDELSPGGKTYRLLNPEPGKKQ